jgi:hypothetical protein
VLFLRQQKKPLDVIQKKDIYIPHTNKKQSIQENAKKPKNKGPPQCGTVAGRKGQAMEITEFLKATSGRRFRPLLTCKDGFTMSVQASRTHYCEPKQDDLKEYTHVEIGRISKTESLLLMYAENGEYPTETIYAFVPVEEVEEIIKKHGGLVKHWKK